MKKKNCRIIIALMLLSSFTACANPAADSETLSGEVRQPITLEGSRIEESIEKSTEEGTEESLEKSTEEGTEKSIEKSIEESTEKSLEENTEEGVPESGMTKEGVGNGNPDEEARKAAYISVLENLYTNHIFPDDKDYGFMGDISENKFAVYDVDSDGEDELLIAYTSTSMAGMVGIIYDYDSESGEVREEFSEFPALQCYNNGVIEASWSHNHGLAGEFWPYTLYQYNQEADTYVKVGMVDAWDKSLSEVNYEGESFPEEVDADGDGIVYYIMKEEYKLDTSVDGEEYNKWRNSYVGEAKQIEIPFINLTEENINEIK